MKNKSLQIIRPRQLAELLDVHLSTLYRWHDEDNIPIKKRQFGPKAVGYLQSDVEKWLNGDLKNGEATK
jgi:predicted DNA-binding transcriptional regulator AlpA